MRPLGAASAVRGEHRGDVRPCVKPFEEKVEEHEEEAKDDEEKKNWPNKNGQVNMNEGDEGESEEARQGVSRKPPPSPTAEELRIHRLTHYPFRSWCPACVAGRAKSWPHRRQESDEGIEGVPSVSFD